jgi:hypothetical protein
LGPFLVKLSELIGKFSEMDEKTVKSAFEFLGWGKVINTISDTIPLLTAPLNLLSGSIGLLSITQIPSAIAAMGTFGGAATTLLGFLGPLALGASALASGWAIGSAIGKIRKPCVFNCQSWR